MNIITRAGTAAVLAAACLGFSGSCLAGSGSGGNADQIFNLLAGRQVPAAQLGKLRAGGVPIVSSVSGGIVSSNMVGANSPTGSISDNQSINGNTGITNIFQNTGNNSLFQSSTTISITLR
jgi:hypothetical protein